MNRILFEKDEIISGLVHVVDARAAHMIDVLHVEKGQKLKTGEVDGMAGTGEVVDVDTVSRGVTLRVEHTQESLPAWADIILAPPRPRVMKRLLPQLAALGVGRIFLVGAAKVEKDFWGATLLKEENLRPLLVDGLMQAGTTALPVLETRRNLKSFVENELDREFPSSWRVIAHPDASRLSDATTPAGKRLLLAVGPEGGWIPRELELFANAGFHTYSLGARILKTETAVISLLARLQS